jgi:hypothetical protein
MEEINTSEEVVEKLMKAAYGDYQAKVSRRIRPLKFTVSLASALIALALMSVSVMAWKTGGGFANYFISLGHYIGIVDDATLEVGETRTDNGVSITLEAVVADEFGIMTMLSIEKTDGSPLKPTDQHSEKVTDQAESPDSISSSASSPSTGDEDSLYIERAMSQPSGNIYLSADWYLDGRLNPIGYGVKTKRIDDMSDPSKAKMVMLTTFVSGSGVADYQKAKLHIYLIQGRWYDEPIPETWSKSVAEGVWDFSFSLDSILSGENFVIDYKGAQQTLRITPWTIVAGGTVSDLFCKEAAPSIYQQWLLDAGNDPELVGVEIEPDIILKDGSIIPTSMLGGSMSGQGRPDDKYNASWFFGQMIDLSDITAIKIDGVSYSLVKE